ncbi:LuxR C-terminal-related transcriptional regulator [Aurantivibrio plasticivorans]
MAVTSITAKSEIAPGVAVFTQSDAGDRKPLADALHLGLEREVNIRVLADGEDVSSLSLLMIDCGCYAPNRIQGWLNSLAPQTIPPVALYNTEESSLHESLLEWPCVKGFFFSDTDGKQMIEGLKLLLNGDFWVPRRLLHAYLERNRRAPTHQIKTAELLTKREREILNLLENGATNAAMASAMNVSEHTIKTHLYNIYKKIDVANRVEAINWSRQNMSAQG